MEVTAWNNGAHHPGGGGYGITVRTRDIDRYFSRDWESVILELEGQAEPAVANVKKLSFWNHQCPHLIKKEIGIWLRNNKKAPWGKGKPPEMEMESIDGNRFTVKFLC